MADGKFFRTEDAAINHIFALTKRHPGCWPGYVRARGGYVTTYEPDPAPAPPPDDDEAEPYDDDELDELAELSEDGSWHD